MPKKHQRRASDSSAILIDEIVATKPRNGVFKPAETENFLRQYFENVPYDDIHDRTPKIMGLAAMSHLEFARVRKPGKPSFLPVN